MESHRNSQSLLVKCKIQHFWKSLAVSHRTKYTLTMWSCTPRYLTQWVEDICPHHDMHMNLYIRFLSNCPKLEILQMNGSTNRGSSIKCNVIRWLKKERELSSYEKTWKNLQCLFLCERSHPEKATLLYDCKDMTFQKGQNYRNSIKISVARGSGRGKDTRMGWAQGIFRPVKVFPMIL